MERVVRIAGQGICGTWLSWYLAKENIAYEVYEPDPAQGATMAASGIINPITGKRFIKTWRGDAVIPFATQAYQEMGAALGQRFFTPYPIYRLLDSVRAVNDWSSRAADPGYQPYIPDEGVHTLDTGLVVNPHGAFRITGGGRVDTPLLLKTYGDYLKSKNKLIEHSLDYHDASVSKPIIACTGVAGADGLFPHIGWLLAKGEYLLVRIPDFYTDRIITGEVTISPYTAPDLYYVGATYQWGYTDALPTAVGRAELIQGIEAMLVCPYSIVYHGAAIRPTVQRRRPYVGFAPEGHIGILNGMGTKGMSLAPFFAAQLARHIATGSVIDEEVGIL